MPIITLDVGQELLAGDIIVSDGCDAVDIRCFILKQTAYFNKCVRADCIHTSGEIDYNFPFFYPIDVIRKVPCP